MNNGGEVLVTEENKQQYLRDVVASKLGEAIRPHLANFVKVSRYCQFIEERTMVPCLTAELNRESMTSFHYIFGGNFR